MNTTRHTCPSTPPQKEASEECGLKSFHDPFKFITIPMAIASALGYLSIFEAVPHAP
jgi:hypothetical protein